MISRALSGLAIALVMQLANYGCMDAAFAPSMPSAGDTYAPGAREYSVDGTVSQAQLALIQSLAWPQTYPDITGAIGFPKHRSGNWDYYAISGDSSRWLVLVYEGTDATGWRMEDRD